MLVWTLTSVFELGTRAVLCLLLYLKITMHGAGQLEDILINRLVVGKIRHQQVSI